MFWRAFVYSEKDPTDRAKQAYNEFKPLDGKFRDNVFVQTKNGAIDFQPREPAHPMFGAMPKTNLALEVQITKEYLGQTTHLVYLPVLFKEIMDWDTLLRAAVLDAHQDRALAEIDRSDEAGRIDRLADSLSLDLIRALTPATFGTHVRLYSVGTKSLAALKAFLQGERFFRHFSLDSAIASYNRAVTLDTTFALALRRANLARGWNDQNGAPYAARAVLFNHGLGPRDSLLVAADSSGSVLSLPESGGPSQYWKRPRDAIPRIPRSGTRSEKPVSIRGSLRGILGVTRVRRSIERSRSIRRSPPRTSIRLRSP